MLVQELVNEIISSDYINFVDRNSINILYKKILREIEKEEVI